MKRELLVGRTWALAALAGTLLASCGCSPGPRLSRLHPVRGKVLYKGQPAVGARVVFHPRHDADLQAPHPAGVVAEDGSFTLTSYKAGDGAPAGDYTVAVLWPDEPGGAAKARGLAPKKHPFNDRLQGAYSNPARPLLQAHVVEGDNDLPTFELR